ncbi:hypothetical protein KMW28_25065 [Flammeovirga yaeyamensis]|uniref:Uncharacterized protein n=1 Tax=Flammeovirga yaeyamensis TaxID=367791 RepID=A0AAX1N9N4_9BACT|nr:hypothetical protein [Flammeovirga yaeyamensis]MBB3699438.1 hypothetical protein [Flammeovirga yaeyamensis]NMF35305.1 hypothetical protein [Flammeovirga yaeyamensis]QWG04165.1 hypothetical protein KMW28_25065 [Flammeovirga yaeyamensis]
MEKTKIDFTMTEGKCQNYFEAFKENLGGKITDNNYRLDNHLGTMDWTAYDIMDGVHFVIADTNLKEPLHIRRKVSKVKDSIHINVVKKGYVSHYFKDFDPCCYEGK